MSSLGQEPSSQKTQVADDPHHQDLSVEQDIVVIARRKDLSSAMHWNLDCLKEDRHNGS